MSASEYIAAGREVGIRVIASGGLKLDCARVADLSDKDIEEVIGGFVVALWAKWKAEMDPPTGTLTVRVEIEP
jgi:hypothetical protein